MSLIRKAFKRLHYPVDIRPSVRWYLAYALSLRNLEEVMAECGIAVDHATLYRWVIRLAACIDEKQMLCLLELLSVPAGSRYSLLEQLRTGPTKVNAASLIQAISRLHAIRSLGITLPTITPVSDTRIAALAWYATTAKTSALQRLPEKRKQATLVAFACCMEATAQDDTIELLEALLRDLFNGAVQADKKNRQRTIKDLDRAAEILSKACKMLLNDRVSDSDIRK